jgi:hypothetical protein
LAEWMPTARKDHLSRQCRSFIFVGSALQATLQAMRVAIERRTARAAEIDAYAKESARSIASQSNIFTELQAIGADPIQLK